MENSRARKTPPGPSRIAPWRNYFCGRLALIPGASQPVSPLRTHAAPHIDLHLVGAPAAPSQCLPLTSELSSEVLFLPCCLSGYASANRHLEGRAVGKVSTHSHCPIPTRQLNALLRLARPRCDQTTPYAPTSRFSSTRAKESASAMLHCKKSG